MTYHGEINYYVPVRLTKGYVVKRTIKWALLPKAIQKFFYEIKEWRGYNEREAYS